MCFFFNDTATTEIYTLSLHDALPISGAVVLLFVVYELYVTDLLSDRAQDNLTHELRDEWQAAPVQDRKSTRLNSSHANISYAVFCLKKKNKTQTCHICYLH